MPTLATNTCVKWHWNPSTQYWTQRQRSNGWTDRR